MKFNDHGIIISFKKYGENSLIVKVFSQNHGIYRGFVKSVKSSKDKVNYQIGNLISFEYRARIEENLGQFFAVDLVESFCSKIMFDKLRLSCATSVLSIIDSTFLEHENHEDLFIKIQNFLQKLGRENHERKYFLADYIKLELAILEALGYGIDLSSCVVTETTDDLAFVSPKSARAVSYSVGKPYQSKLLRLPPFLINDADHDENQLLDGLKLSGFFLERYVFEDGERSDKKQQFFYRDQLRNELLKN